MTELRNDPLADAGLVPVMTIDRADDAASLAAALSQGGISYAEITFRTPAAAEAIDRMRSEAPQMTIGAGTVLTVEQADRAVRAGAQYLTGMVKEAAKERLRVKAREAEPRNAAVNSDQRRCHSVTDQPHILEPEVAIAPAYRTKRRISFKHRRFSPELFARHGIVYSPACAASRLGAISACATYISFMPIPLIRHVWLSFVVVAHRAALMPPVAQVADISDEQRKGGNAEECGQGVLPVLMA
jgi:hypothetical protein